MDVEVIVGDPRRDVLVLTLHGGKHKDYYSLVLIAVQAISDIRIPRVVCVSKAVYEVREYSISPRHRFGRRLFVRS